ncbi:hypothetical protein GCM10027175_21880 [Hymenobacter latericoloratus]
MLSYGQSSSSDKSSGKLHEPIFIINSNIISNGIFTQLDPMSMNTMLVYRDTTKVPPIFKNLASLGIITVNYTRPIVSKSFAEIGIQQGIHGPFGVIINGRKLSPVQISTLRIVPEAIGRLRILPVIPTTSQPIIDIQITEYKPVKNNKPGQVYIR